MAGVGPARAGMIRGLLASIRRVPRWPRTSGDDPSAATSYTTIYKLAPHERG